MLKDAALNAQMVMIKLTEECLVPVLLGSEPAVEIHFILNNVRHERSSAFREVGCEDRDHQAMFSPLLFF